MNIAEKVAAEISRYKQNSIIMEWITKEAVEKTAQDISASSQEVELLVKTNKEVSDRVDDYINAGLFGCYLSTLSYKE
ncbi:hypothetical protein [Nitrosomonas ureae]|uniref:Uncharacterized protein n=1 Tax=Nitrosomonas ureae TaxID=44577 RepID=A0A286ABT8_9PROT|nr:hypothetical protein [Nitrosomonas ureae]SOD19369.1 hypothetical protein SAMN06297164_2353 [Nitrosomonas ureae]